MEAVILQWTVFSCDMGTVYLIVGAQGLIRSTLPLNGDPPPEIAGQLQRAVPTCGRTAPYETWLSRYFSGDFSMAMPPLCPSGSTFQRDVWQATALVPAGSTASYADIARRAGYPRAFRAVGGAMARNPVPLFVPCHRVIGSDGTLGGFGGGIQLKRRLLRHEGVDLSN